MPIPSMFEGMAWEELAFLALVLGLKFGPLVGLAGFCLYWFVIRRKKSRKEMPHRSGRLSVPPNITSGGCDAG